MISFERFDRRLRRDICRRHRCVASHQRELGGRHIKFIQYSAPWMVLYYGLLALETANNTIAATATAPATTAVPGLTFSERTGLSHKQRYLSNSIGKMPSSSSSSNSWIYTEDLRKRFEERYADCRYVFVPVYINPKAARRHQSTTAIPSQKIDRENSWMYSRSLRDHLFYSTSKISLPLAANISSSACCVTNHGFMRDETPAKKNFKTRLFKRSASTKEKSAAHVSLSSLPFRSFTASTSSFPIAANYLGKHRSNAVVEEEDDEGVEDENHSTPLIKHNSMVASLLANPPLINPTTTSELTLLSSPTMSKHSTTHTNKLTRLRAFFFKSSPRSPRSLPLNTLSTSSHRMSRS